MEEERERENFVVRLMTISFFHVLFISFFFFFRPLFHTSHFLWDCFFVLKVKCKEKKDLWFLRPLTIETHPLYLCLALSAPLPIRPKASWVLGANCERLSNFPPPPSPLRGLPPSSRSPSLPPDIC